MKTHAFFPTLLTLSIALFACGGDESSQSQQGSAQPGAGGGAGAPGLPFGGFAQGNGGTASGGKAGGFPSAGGMSSQGGTSSLGGMTASGGKAQGNGGKAGEASGGNGSATCPPEKVDALPSCSSPFTGGCAACLCDDAGASKCGEKWDACVGDEGCARAVDCLVKGCSSDDCVGLAGSAAGLLFELQKCFLQVCPEACTFSGGSGGSSAGGAGQGGSGQAGGEQGGSAQGGEAQGGSQQGGSAQGGSGQAGSSQGGTAQGGQAQAGSSQGGSAQGGGGQAGSSQGGSQQGGAGQSQGGAGQAGSGQAGSSQGGAGQAGSTGAGGSAPACDGVFVGSCGTCLETSCCDKVTACDDTCQACVSGDASATGCTSNAAYAALDACMRQSCADECITLPGFLECSVPSSAPSGGSCANGGFCNPVTNEGCQSGEVCGYDDFFQSFSCFKPSSTVGLCQSCDANNACSAGRVCMSSGACGRFCCTDADCGVGAACAALSNVPDVGVCVQRVFEGNDPSNPVGADGCANDYHEPNDAKLTASTLDALPGCWGVNGPVIGVLDPGGDKDWFTFHGDAGFFCGDPVASAQVTATTGTQVCIYVTCDALAQTTAANITCPAGTTPSTAPGGAPGCCAQNGVQPTIKCGGDIFSSAEATLFISVEASGAISQCVPYELNYGL